MASKDSRLDDICSSFTGLHVRRPQPYARPYQPQKMIGGVHYAPIQQQKQKNLSDTPSTRGRESFVTVKSVENRYPSGGYTHYCSCCKRPYNIRFSVKDKLLEHRIHDGIEFVKILCPFGHDEFLILHQCQHYQADKTYCETSWFFKEQQDWYFCNKHEHNHRCGPRTPPPEEFFEAFGYWL